MVNQKSGVLYGIGVGPGDPELLTLKAVRLLNECAVVAYPAPEVGTGLAWEIAKPHLSANPEVLPLRLPISVDPFPAQQAYDDAAESLGARLESGKSVAVLCEGDPLFYGSFMYLLERLSGRFRMEVVPGVSSPMACAAVLGWPLVSRNEPLTVLPGPLPEAELELRLRAPGAFVLMKVGRHFRKLRSLLERSGLSDHARYVEHATRPDQRVLPLGEVDPETVPYFSMILVRRA